MAFATQTENRRQEFRHYHAVFEAVARYEGQVASTRLYLTDVSRGGAFLECATPAPPGTSIGLQVTLPEGKVALARAYVVHAVTPDPSREKRRTPGMGIRFVEVDKTGHQWLSSVLQQPKLTVAAPTTTDFSDSLPLPGADSGYDGRRPVRTTERMEGMAIQLKESAKAALEQGLHVQAASELKLALSYCPDDEELLSMAKTVFADANQRRAEKACHQGNHYETLGDDYRAEVSFVQAAALYPGNADCQRKIALLALKRSDLRTAYARITQAIQARPEDPELYLLAARISHTGGDREGALVNVEQARKFGQNRSDIAEYIRQFKEDLQQA